MRFACATVIAFFLALTSRAIEVRVSPENPDIQDRLFIEIAGCTQGGVLHWGVNAEGIRWETPDPAYVPEGSAWEGTAARTRLAGPDGNGICRIELGPFNAATQLVSSVNFAIQWDDGTWSNKDEENYNIKVSYGRITWSPEHPSVNDKITIQIHRSPGAGHLRWGVNEESTLWKPPLSNYWPKGTVLAEDKIAVDTPFPKPGPDGVSTLVLGPFNQAAQVVRSVHLAVHWGDVWDTDDSRNYNFHLRLNDGPGAPLVTFVSPSNSEIVVDAPRVIMQAEDADNVDMWLNGKNVATIREAPFELRIPFQQLKYGRHLLTAKASLKEQAGLEEIEFWKVPPHVAEAIPEGTPWGATIHDDGTVTFALHAPGKLFVSLVGDFNSWDPWVDMMKSSPDGTWWIRRPVPPGEHLYQFSVEGRRLLADPYAGDISWKDPKGREGYRPEDAKAVLEVGSAPYEWQARDYVRPSLDQLVIYEFHIDDLAPGQGYTGVIAKLDYIRDMGFTAIEPLPFTEFPLDHSWGYNPAYHFAPESSYGTPEEARRMIDEAHKRGLAVIHDMVLNHMDNSSALYQLYGSDYDASPYFRQFLGDNWGFPDLDQETRAVKRYVADLLAHWIREYRIDGFRYDATRWVGWQGYNDWGASWFAYAAKQVDPGNFQIAEHLPADPELINTTEMDTGWHDGFHWPVRRMVVEAYLNREEFGRLMDPATTGFTNALGRMAYVESHDEERIMWELEEKKYPRVESLRRCRLAFVLTLTAPGTAMIYAGQEFGEDTRKKVGSNPMQWEKLKRPDARTLREDMKSLVTLRTTHPALRGQQVRVFNEGLPDAVAVYHRIAGEEAVVVAANFGSKVETVVAPLPFTGRWLNVLEKREVVALQSPELVFQLPPGGSIVLARIPEGK